MRKVAIVGALAVMASLLFVVPALASHPQQFIPNGTSIFEIDTDANLVVDDDGNEDWDEIPQGDTAGTERRKADSPSGANDESFTQGTKEDTAVPVIETGSIPPNKSDLLTFGGYLETTAEGDEYLNIYWHRVQEPNGTTNMDFEFNKSSTLSANNVTPVRTAGDVLIQYDLSQGGTNPTLWISRWVTTGANSQCEGSGSKVPCWSDKVNLTAAGDAVGSINTSAIDADDSDGLGPISPRTFGEAQIDFAAFAGGEDECVSFGSAYLKSRSSDSFTSALKDFIPPLTLNFDNCGDLKILKTDDGDPATNLVGAEFDVFLDNDPFGGAGPDANDTLVGECTTDTNGECLFEDLIEGDYWVVETVAPAGYDLPTPPYQLVSVTAAATDPVLVTFVDVPQLGAIQITKTAKHAASETGSIPLEGVVFTITGGNLDADGEDITTDANGVACLDGLSFADYVATEGTVANYAPVGDGVDEFTVDNKADCDLEAEEEFAGETLAFDNNPLTNVTVSVDSQVIGGTDSEISCDTTPDATTGSTDDVTGDGSVLVEDLEPTAPDVTLTCTITIDP